MGDERVPDTAETEEVLGPLPSGDVEEPDRFPGGADSLADEEKYGGMPSEPLAREVPSEANPATSEAPEGVQEGDDKTQDPEDDAGKDLDAGEESDKTGDKDADAEDAAGDDEGDESVDTAEEPGA